MGYKLIDLTQTIDQGIPDWGGCCGFQMRQVLDYPDGMSVQELQMPNGIGTHMDAPSHFIKDGLDIAAISVEQFMGPGVVIDVSEKADQHYALSVHDLIEFEKQYGLIPKKSIVIVNTGWGKKWHDPIQYRHEDAEGVMRFPCVSIEAAEFLLQRQINGMAIDTLSPDGPDANFPVHHVLLGAGKFIIENIKIADELPKMGFTLIALPIKIKSATEAPCRVVVIMD